MPCGVLDERADLAGLQLERLLLQLARPSSSRPIGLILPPAAASQLVSCCLAASAKAASLSRELGVLVHRLLLLRERPEDDPALDLLAVGRLERLAQVLVGDVTRP